MTWSASTVPVVPTSAPSTTTSTQQPTTTRPTPRPTTTIAATTTAAELSSVTVPLLVGVPQLSPPELPVPLPPPDANAIEPGYRVGTIEIPRIGLDKSFFEGVTISTLNRGPGHWPGTALPGMLGNVVFGGHRTSKGGPFRHLDQLLPGDEVIFTTDSGRFVYHVTRTEVVTPDSMWIINQTEAYTATLFACHPIGSTRERIVVFLELAG